jgi:hypothetical protein
VVYHSKKALDKALDKAGSISETRGAKGFVNSARVRYQVLAFDTPLADAL